MTHEAPEPFAFQVLARCSHSRARRGRLETPRGPVDTPVFMPVGTQATVKGMLPEQVRALGASIVLGNTYHLGLRPGPDVVEALGGLHAMMAWDGPILTDSGGFQVFSLADQARIDDDGVTFRSHIDGAPMRLDAERSLTIQQQLGSDIAMIFDQCPAVVDEREPVARAVARTIAWAKRARTFHERRGGATQCGQAVFGIVQGGTFADLRRTCSEALVDIGFDGYAVGGVSVGETKSAMQEAIEATTPHLPEDRPRYLMGVGSPEDFFTGVMEGIDMFDCVSPTRLARMAIAYTSIGRRHVRNAKFQRDRSPIDPHCTCACCRTYSAGTLRHLFHAKEMLGPILLTIHNLHVFLDLMRRIREAIVNDTLLELRDTVLARMTEDEATPTSND